MGEEINCSSRLNMTQLAIIRLENGVVREDVITI